ncbi:MAG TPA: hypothetical protein VFP54_09530 [Acidimicrobiales bacterium]|nr:hypothetical protein [Acidimicrobiales bacterium]
MLDRILSALAGAGWTKGFRGGNQLWLAAGLAAWMLRRTRSRRGPSPVFTEDLEPGGVITITHLPPRR